ncbi:xanthine dehydrogenase accessory protein XdhC [Ollibium composti]|uniref:Xanthine dehydrogenase accessory protein XdhC n=1 Tax=Ollibium composti TaxID=2675109 RepID=A0ABY2QBH1_9HYPH|nr:xanthine dehydrogenase accessory protein XdhC [Mesorhizobium composti]THF59028.1 xanthine dehydrogenase accessory protein XdhC [Mesorhizobium composti]
MTTNVQDLKDFLGMAGPVALVEVAATKGSTPRETGAYMLVSPAAIHGTIGGGQLEYMAIDKARQVLRNLPTSPPPLTPPRKGEGKLPHVKSPSPLRGGVRGGGNDAGLVGGMRFDIHEVCATLDIPLGPEIGQCCGGRVEVAIRPVDAAVAAGLIAAAERQEQRLPHLYIFGGGHVGKALAAAVALLPVHAVVVETRAEELEGMPEGVGTLLTPMPEAAVREAPAGSAFAVLTHDHALDFLIVAEALKRADAAYVGMIGSKTKKATFKSWFLKTAGGSEAEFARLVSPIGGEVVKDKRPPVIAALAAAEMMTALALHGLGAAAEDAKSGASFEARSARTSG